VVWIVRNWKVVAGRVLECRVAEMKVLAWDFLIGTERYLLETNLKEWR